LPPLFEGKWKLQSGRRVLWNHHIDLVFANCSGSDSSEIDSQFPARQNGRYGRRDDEKRALFLHRPHPRGVDRDNLPPDGWGGWAVQESAPVHYGAECWVSGIRRGDSETRATAAKFGWDKRFGLWKLNPLADWDDKRVWNHIKEHHVPYNPLHDQGYPSIGCIPCTSKPGEGEGDRAGRWAGTDRTECGING